MNPSVLMQECHRGNEPISIDASRQKLDATMSIFASLLADRHTKIVGTGHKPLFEAL